jgi:hypothetical protein
MECEDAGSLNECIGCKVDRDVEGRKVKLTQPVLIQSFQDEFELPGRDQVKIAKLDMQFECATLS